MMQHRNLGLTLATLALALGLGGCSGSFYARSPEDYRVATRALLESKQSSFQQCYEGVIATTPDAAGTVAVSFVVEEKTGKILTPQSLPASTAPGGGGTPDGGGGGVVTELTGTLSPSGGLPPWYSPLL